MLAYESITERYKNIAITYHNLNNKSLLKGLL